MIFSTFTETTNLYLKSLRILKDFISFDIYLKSNWSIPKKYSEEIEVMRHDNSDRAEHSCYSFVVKNEKDLVDKVEMSINHIIRFNKEREEKEKLFKDKIQELKSMFETKDVDSLKRLYFEINENTTLKLEDNGKSERDPELIDVVQEGKTQG